MANYDSVEKKAKDLCKKGYALGKVVKTEAKTAGGVKWTTETNLGDNVTTKLNAKFATEFAKVEKLEVNCCAGVNVKLVNDSLVNGLEITVEGNAGPKGSDSASVALEYSVNDLTLDGSFDVLKMSGNANALFSYNDFALGAGADFSSKGLAGWKAVAGYVTKDSRFSLSTANLAKYDVKAFHILSNDVTLAAQLSFAADGGKKSFEVGGKWVVDADYTVQAKVNNNAVATVSCKQQLTPRVALTASQEVGLKDMKAAKAGFELSFC